MPAISGSKTVVAESTGVCPTNDCCVGNKRLQTFRTGGFAAANVFEIRAFFLGKILTEQEAL